MRSSFSSKQHVEHLFHIMSRFWNLVLMVFSTSSSIINYGTYKRNNILRINWRTFFDEMVPSREVKVIESTGFRVALNGHRKRKKDSTYIILCNSKDQNDQVFKIFIETILKNSCAVCGRAYRFSLIKKLKYISF